MISFTNWVVEELMVRSIQLELPEGITLEDILSVNWIECGTKSGSPRFMAGVDGRTFIMESGELSNDEWGIVRVYRYK